VKKKKAARKIIIKTPAEIEIMREANIIVAEVLGILKDNLAPGITTLELNNIAENEIIKRKGIPAFKGYRGFPAALCISINEEVVHGIPSPYRIIGAGDIVSMDLGVLYKGYYGDSAVSVVAGDAGSSDKKRLIKVAQDALDKGIEKVAPGGHLFDISAAIQKVVEDAGYNVVRKFVGHGIGRSLHESPEVPNFGMKGQGIMLREGLVLAIEPMVNEGVSDVRVLDDGWTVVTMDGSFSAHVEHSVAITKKGPYILSKK
jgi:methionyl aminopeptidase